MKLSYFTKTQSGEERFERWCDLPVTPDAGEPQPRILFKPIPSRLELFADWKACVNHEMAAILLNHLGKEHTEGYITLFMQHLTNPALVDMDKMTQRVAQKYIKDWDGMTDDDGTPVKFKLKTFLSDVLPTIAVWVVNTIVTLSTENDLTVETEKKT